MSVDHCSWEKIADLKCFTKAIVLFAQSIIDTQLTNSSTINNGEINTYVYFLVYMNNTHFLPNPKFRIKGKYH